METKRKRRWFQFSLRSLLIMTRTCVIAAASVALVALPLELRAAVDEKTTGKVSGIVRVTADPPAAKTWKLEEAMQKATGDEIATDAMWVVGKDKGLANCVVSLFAVDEQAKQSSAVKSIKLEKVGWHFSPRVLVATPGTKLHYGNTNSPCKGFRCNSPKQSWNEMVPEGAQVEIVLKSAGNYKIDCPIRAYMIAWIRVVDTPYSSVTDADGRFVIAGVPPGEYKIVVWHEAAGNLPKGAGPSTVTVVNGGEKAVEYRVEPKH